MSDRILKPSDLKILLQCNGIQNYKFKAFLSSGCFPKLLLENTKIGQEVVGKIVSSPSEGELKQWPKLHHQNLNRLLDVVNIEERAKIFISPMVGKSIMNVIHEDSFHQHPLCFDRKRNFVKDILLGLDYMHRNSMYLLNLTYSSVAVCNFDDRAIICDFSYTTERENIPKTLFPKHIPFKPPEVQNLKADCTVYCLPLDMWASGIFSLQIFTQNALPWRGTVMESIECLDNKMLQSGNVGSHLHANAAAELKTFLEQLLFHDPKFRISAEEAYKSEFLQNSQNRLGEQARNFWKRSEGSKFCRLITKESNFVNDEDVLSSYTFGSEIDVISAVSKNHSQDSFGECENSSAKIGKCLPAKTISEPGNTIHLEKSKFYTRLNASFPSLRRKDSIQSEIFCDNNYISNCKKFKSTLSNNNDKCHDLPDNNQRVENSKQNILHNYVQYKHSPNDIFLTEWEADISADESTVYSPSSHRIKKGGNENEQFSTKTYFRPEESFQTCPKSLNCTLPMEYYPEFHGGEFDDFDKNSEIYYCNESSARGIMDSDIALNCSKLTCSNSANQPLCTISNRSSVITMKPDDIIASDTSRIKKFENVQCEICMNNISDYSRREFDGNCGISPLVGNYSADNSKIQKDNNRSKKKPAASKKPKSENVDSSFIRNTEHLTYDLADNSIIKNHYAGESSSKNRKKHRKCYHRLCFGCKK